MAENRYYWLKLQEDFFRSNRIKRMRKFAGGDTLTIIYLKIQLLSIKNGGMLKYTGLMRSFAEELALDIDEEVENVELLLRYLASCELIETSDDINYMLPYAVQNIGSEGSSAQRMRRFRESQNAISAENNKKISSNNDSASHCDANVRTKCSQRYGEKEIDIDKDKEIDKEKECKEKESVAKATSDTPKRSTKVERNLKVMESLLDQYKLSDAVISTLDEWMRYKGEIGDEYKPTGCKTLLTRVATSVLGYGDEAIINLIRESISNGWHGVIWERLGRTNTRPRPSMSAVEEFVMEGDYEPTGIWGNS